MTTPPADERQPDYCHPSLWIRGLDPVCRRIVEAMSAERRQRFAAIYFEPMFVPEPPDDEPPIVPRTDLIGCCVVGAHHYWTMPVSESFLRDADPHFLAALILDRAEAWYRRNAPDELSE